jgi:hypothetical protein
LDFFPAQDFVAASASILAALRLGFRTAGSAVVVDPVCPFVVLDA